MSIINHSVIGIATLESRHGMLKKTIDSLVGQSDYIYVYLNDYPYKHDWMFQYENRGVQFLLGKDHLGDLGDAGKFILFNSIKDKFYFSADDDIIYPKDYVEKTISEMTDKNISVLSYHGRRFGDQSLPIKGYLKNCHQNTKRVHFNAGNNQPEYVHILGTGVSCFDKVSLNDIALPIQEMSYEYRNISDVWVSTILLKNHITPYIPKFKGNWINPNLTQKLSDTIFSKHLENDEPKDFFNKQMEGYTLPLCQS